VQAIIAKNYRTEFCKATLGVAFSLREKLRIHHTFKSQYYLSMNFYYLRKPAKPAGKTTFSLSRNAIMAQQLSKA
jgi:hypothetical protein